MSNYIATHYDLEEARGSQMLVLDTFKRMAGSIQNEVIPASREDVSNAGIENPAASLTSSGNIYTTIPLKPLSKDVNFVNKNYLHGILEMTTKFETFSDSALTTAANLAAPLDVAVGTYDTAALPSRVQLMLGNSIIWQNQFQRQEAICGMSSLPQEVVETNPQYTTCSKLENRSNIPGIYYTLITNPSSTGINEVKFIFDFTIDLDKLTPLLSNIPFITTEMGDLRLRVFFERLEEAMFWCPLPTARSVSGVNEIINPNFHVISPQPFNKSVCLYQPHIQAQATAANTIAAGTASTAIYIKPSFVSWRAVDVGLEIIQSNFSIKESAREAMKSYIGTDNKIVIPSQTWSTSLSTVAPTTATGELIFQISAYNIYLLAFLFPYADNWTTYYPAPPFKSVDIQLNSKSINYIPYRAIDGRVIKDTIQAFINDDKYGANENLLNSLNLPLNASNTGYNATQYLDRFSNKLAPLSYSPNVFVLAKGLSPPNCFEKGYCYASSNPQSTQVRFKYEIQSGLETGATNTLNANQSLTSTNSGAFCLALQDCCLVLNYNPSVGVAQSGSVIYAEPSVV